jgi:hypothetical protein
MSSAAATTCARCAAVVAPHQEYCLVCGLRLSGRRLGPVPTDVRAVRLRVGGLALVAVAGAAVAIGFASDGPAGERVRTATGGSVPAPAPSVDTRTRLALWPRTQSGWTIVLASIPKTQRRDRAVAVAQRARSRGLQRVGVLDSSRFASLRPGYWMTFAGRYQSEADATGSLRRARATVKGARVQRVEP